MRPSDQRIRIFPGGRNLGLSTLSTVIFFLLGTGIAHYLGNGILWDKAIAGLGIVLSVVVAAYYLKEFFDLQEPDIKVVEKKNLDISKRLYLIVGLSALTGAISLSYVILIQNMLRGGGVIFLCVLLCFIFLFSVPPFRFSSRGYGEFLLSIVIANIIPAFAFTLQVSVLHKLVPLISFPLMFFYLAMLICTSLQGYFADMLAGRKSMLILIDWKLGLELHNWLVVGGFLLLAINSILGLPWNLAWPMFLPLPVYGFLLYELQRIKSGMKPRWVFLNLTGYAGIGLMVYMILYTVWVR